MAMVDQNHSNPIKSPAELLLREVWSRGDLTLVDELVTDDYVEHAPVRPKPVRGPEALKDQVAQFRQGMSDLTRTIDRTFVDGSTVVVDYTATGTHDGTLLGIEPTGTPVDVDGVFLAQVADGRLVEGTDQWDVFGLLRQLGALPDHIADQQEY